MLACPRRPGAGQAGFRLSFLSLPPSLPPAMRGIDGKQLAFLSFSTFSWHDRGSTVPSNPSLSRRSLDVLVFLHFRKAALRTTVLSAVFSSEVFLLHRAACVLGQPTVTIYGRIYIRILFTSPRRKDGECMAGHRSAGLSEFGFNALGIHPLVVRLPRLSPSLRVLLCECKRAFTQCPSIYYLPTEEKDG